MDEKISIVIPAKNEHLGLSSFLPKLIATYPDSEIIVVNDGSTDNTEALCKQNRVICLNHPNSKGNGAAIKSGVRKASGDIVVFMDADGQHQPEMIELLLNKINQGFDMVIGARSNKSQASILRLLANKFYNKFAAYMTGEKIEDLTSGFRAVKRELFLEILHLLPNGFSYPTTSTMAFFRTGHNVAYVPIDAEQRLGKSHINIFKDGYRFILILFKIGTLFSPLKIFMPISMIFFSAGVVNYVYTFFIFGRFTNMSALMLSTSVIVFLIGLISEQITMLIYKPGK